MKSSKIYHKNSPSYIISIKLNENKLIFNPPFLFDGKKNSAKKQILFEFFIIKLIFSIFKNNKSYFKNNIYYYESPKK